MPELRISVRLLLREFHGRADGGAPEWPPSPLRLYQALVAAAAAQHADGGPGDSAREGLRWLASIGAPDILAPRAATGTPYRIAVPNNDGDVVLAAWAKGREPKRQFNELKTMKTVLPVHLLGDDALHYSYALSAEALQENAAQIETIARLAAQVVALGWGVDVAIGGAQIVDNSLSEAGEAELWTPRVEGGSMLRVPVTETFDALVLRHDQFVRRLDQGGLASPEPLGSFRSVAYARATDYSPRPTALFSVLTPDGTGFRPFDAARRSLTVAGMLRHAARRAAEDTGWTPDDVNGFVLGHADSETQRDTPLRRFAFLPLPSIESRGNGVRLAGAIRRALVTCLGAGCDDEVAWARTALLGRELVDEHSGEIVALLGAPPPRDGVSRAFLGSSATWATVTPMSLPGFDDPAHYRRRLARGVDAAEQHRLLAKLDRRIDELIRRAIVQGGFSETLARRAEVEWRRSGFWPGTELPDRYGAPPHLSRFPRFHVRIAWHGADGRMIAIPGPICLGGGRHYGLGLFAAM